MTKSARRAVARPRTTPSRLDRPERLVQAAHELLVERTLSGFKVLDVAARAGANVALINYHFGGRDGLLDEVVRRVAGQIAQTRAERLAALLASCPAGLPSPLDVLRCWLEPWLESVEHENNREVMMLMLDVMFAADVDRSRKERLLESSVEVTGRFVGVLTRIFPAVSREQMTWRMLCAVGSSYLVLGQAHPIGWEKLAHHGKRSMQPVRQQAVKELVTFILAGLSAPSAAIAGAGPAPRRKATGR